MNVLVSIVFFAISTQAFTIDWFKIKRSDPQFILQFLKNHHDKIVGGEEAEPHSIPYQVGLIISYNEYSSFCGGSLISENTVLTAAHCINGSSNIQIILGAHNINLWEESQQLITSNNYTVHEKWDQNTLQNDIALIHLPTSAKLNEYVQIIRLPSRSETSDFAGKRARVSGWGKASDSATGISPTLRFVNVVVTTNEFCEYWYKGYITEKHICTDGGGGYGACGGDSGGPLVLYEQLIGVASFSVSLGCEVDWPSGYQRVTSHLDWIEDNSDVVIGISSTTTTTTSTPYSYNKASSDVDWSNVKRHNLMPRMPANFWDLPKNRIVGGQEAVPNSIKYQAALRVTVGTENYFCGASLISTRYLLTAAHCVDGASEIQVTLGAHKINEAEDTQVKITTDAYTMHSGWDATQIINDIAVIDLKQEIELTENIQPVNLPTYADVANEFTDSVARVSGWGLDSDSSDSISPVLREVYATVISNLVCNISYLGQIHNSNICTGGSGGVGSCSGDSGGPLVHNDKLIGIVSFGLAIGCEVGWPSAFTRVTTYLDWIQAHSDVIIH
nr:transmembrane protease serine 9-like [Onthophagus taurus]